PSDLGIAGSAVADLDDLVLAGAAGRLDGDDVALVLADQRARHRRRDRDLAVLDVGLEVADDLVALLRATVFVGQQHGGAEHHLVADLQRGHVDHLRVRELALELLDAALDEALLLARGVVFRVFLQVAVRTRLGDRSDDGRTLDALPLFQLRAQTLRTLCRDRWAHVRFNSSCSSCSAHTGPLPRYSRE